MVKLKKGKFLADLANPGDEVLVARGGQGGVRNLWVSYITTMLGVLCFYLFCSQYLTSTPSPTKYKKKKKKKKSKLFASFGYVLWCLKYFIVSNRYCITYSELHTWSLILHYMVVAD